jgi:hypothetical protein
VLSGFLPWARTLNARTFEVNSTIGWKYLFSQPLNWIVVLLFVIGVMGLLYFKQIRYGIFSALLAIVSFVLLLKTALDQIASQPKTSWNDVFKFGFPVSLVFLGVTFIALIVYLVALKKAQTEE